MTGEPRPGMFREMSGGEVRFFRIHQNDDGVLVIFELHHKDNVAVKVKDSKRPLDQVTWAKLVTWQ